VTQVDFYILDSDSDDARLLLACKIVDKATQLDHHVYLNSTSDDEARKLDELPSQARAYLDRLRELIDTPITYVSVGTRRDQIIGL